MFFVKIIREILAQSKLCLYLCTIIKHRGHPQHNTIMDNVFSKLSIEKKAEYAAQMVIMDAIENGLTTVEQAVMFMKTDIFEKAVKRYMELMN